MFHNKLINWYLNNKRDLPWRRTKNPYYIWLSEIMLQQTRIEQGLPYYLKFTETFPTVHDLAKADEELVLKMWQGLGYYSRARNLHATAKYVSEELHGVFPNNYVDLLKLKGVGDYTASAIASFCFGEVQPVVDGNVYRVLSRFLGINKPINESNSLKTFKEVALELIDRNDPATFNQALMEFGAKHCKPKNPMCDLCVFKDNCYALNHEKVDVLPVKIKKQRIKKRFFNYLVFVSNDRKTRLQKRTEKGIWQHLYEFPLIESNKQLSTNEIKTHDLLRQENIQSISIYNENPIVHKLSHQHLITQFWIVESIELTGNNIPVDKISEYPVPILIHNFIEAFNF